MHFNGAQLRNPLDTTTERQIHSASRYSAVCLAAALMITRKKQAGGSYLANHRAPATAEILCHQPPACLETVPTLQISSVFTWTLSPVSMPQLPGSFTIEIHRIQQEIIATVEAVLATASCPRMYGSVWMEPWMLCMEINVTLCYLLSQLETDRSESTNLHFNVKPTKWNFRLWIASKMP